MPKKIYADLEVTHNTTSRSSNTIREINGVQADAQGEINVPYYSKARVDQMTSMLPISRVGTLDYLPMNINGSFEGSTNYDTKRIYPVVLENDGTMVYLRPGTNGSTFGYYYSYIPSARDNDAYAPIQTNTKYTPSFFTPNHKLIDFIGSNAGEVLMMRTNNGTKDTYTVSLTNGTMNEVAHQHLEFDRTLIPNTDPQYAMICSGAVHIWCIDSYSYNAAFSMSLYVISTADLINKVPIVSRIVGFSGKTLYGDVVTSNNSMQFTPTINSTNAADKPFMLPVTDGQFLSANTFQLNTDGMVQAVSNADDSLIRVAVFHPYDANSSNATLGQYTWGFSFVFNRAAKSYTYDTQSLAPIVVTARGSTVTNTNQFDVDMSNINGFPNAHQGNVPTIFQTFDGMVFSTIARYVTTPQHKVSKGTINNFTNLYDSLNLKTRTLSNIKVNYITPTYGSEIGENLIGPQLVSPTKMIMAASGSENDVTYAFDNIVSTEFSGARTYNYNSINGSALTGYAPNSNRVHLDNQNYMYNGLITLIQNGTTKVYGSTIIEGVNKPISGLLDPNTMQFSGTYTLHRYELLTELKDRMVSGGSVYNGNVVESKIIVYYVPDTTYCKSIAVVYARTDVASGNNVYIITCELDVVLSGTVIHGFNIQSWFLNTRNVFSNGLAFSYLSRAGGMTVSKYGDFTYMGFNSLIDARTTSNSAFCCFLAKVDNTTLKISTRTLTMLNSNYVSIAGGCYHPGAIPGVGFGVYEYGAITDMGTKLVFKNFGTTSAQFDTMIANISATPVERIVVASQEVAHGFIVYFTQSVPVLLGGKFGKLQPISIDLRTIKADPANTTFYIYVYLQNDVMNYAISTTALSEALYRTYIGTIVTGSSSITSIQSEKVTRFLTYRPSTTKRGSAIPASTGVPSSTGTRWK